MMLMKAVNMEKEDKQDPANIGKFVFSKTIIDLDLLKRSSVEELFNYVNSKDVELTKLKLLIKKANRELRIDSRQLFIKKASVTDKEAENRICITKR